MSHPKPEVQRLLDIFEKLGDEFTPENFERELNAAREDVLELVYENEDQECLTGSENAC